MSGRGGRLRFRGRGSRVAVGIEEVREEVGERSLDGSRSDGSSSAYESEIVTGSLADAEVEGLRS